VLRLLQQDGGYSKEEVGNIMCLFADDIAIADTYADAEDEEDRHLFIHSLLARQK